MEKFDSQQLARPMFEINTLESKYTNLSAILPPLTQRMGFFEREFKQGIEQTPSIILTPSDLEEKGIEKVVKILEEMGGEVYLVDENGNVYNLRRCLLQNEKELPDELADKLLHSSLFSYVEKLWKENETKNMWEDLSYVLGKVGIVNWFKSLFDQDKEEEVAEKIVEHFCEIGKLEELKEYLKNWGKENGSYEIGLQKLEIKEKILEELPHVKVNKRRKFGFIPSSQVTLNPGYESFFTPLIEAYGKDMVYSALKGLEKEVPEMLKGNLKALTREFEKREGISRKRGYYLLALGILGLGAFLNIYFNFVVPKEKETQRLEQLKKVGLGEEQARDFDSIFKKYADETLLNSGYNQTILEFASYYGKNLQLAKEVFNIYSNFKLANNFLSFASEKPNSLDFVKKYPNLVKTFNFKLPLELYSENSTIFEELYRNISSDPRITIDRSKLLSFASQLFLDLGYTGKVKVLVPGSNEYKEEFLSKPTIQAFGNYSIAINQLGLPKHDRNTLFLLGNATQMDPEIVDFSPIRFKSVDLTDVYLIPIPSRETWITAEILKRIKESGFDILGHPEMFLGLNGKIITNAWCIFNDSPYYSIAGIEKKINNRVIKVSDEDVLNLMMLQWGLYSQFSPQRNGSKLLYNRDFPWYNSSELKALYPDKNELRVALFKLFYLPETTYSMKEGKRVFGIKASETSLLEAKKEYETISSLYPSGKIGKWSEDPRDYYYGWLGDRAGNGLNNTVAQYLGIDPGLVFRVKNWVEWLREVKDNNGIDGYLTKNWKYWDLVKFIVGYERWSPKGGAHEAEGIAYIIPETLRMFGFPTDLTIISPAPLGAGGSEWSISLPYPIVESMKKHFPDSNILIGPGYTFGLYSCGDGLIKERGIDDLHKPIENGITKVFKWVGEKRVYLMKRD